MDMDTDPAIMVFGPTMAAITAIRIGITAHQSLYETVPMWCLDGLIQTLAHVAITTPAALTGVVAAVTAPAPAVVAVHADPGKG